MFNCFSFASTNSSMKLCRGDFSNVVGLPVAVGTAVPEIRSVCSLKLTRNGGFGAVREFAELLLKARGEWIPGLIDPAANNRSQRDGERLMADYQGEGLDLTAHGLR